MTELADEQVMILVQEGKINYLELLFQRYKKQLYNYFLKCTLDADESKDLTQMVFIRLLKYKASFDPDRSFNTWLFQIARNLVKDHFKKMKVYRDQFNVLDQIPEYEDELSTEQVEREEKLHKALAMLPKEKRELLVMTKFQGKKYEEMAEIMEVSVSAIKVKVHRTIAQLREIYFEKLKD